MMKHECYFYKLGKNSMVFCTKRLGKKSLLSLMNLLGLFAVFLCPVAYAAESAGLHYSAKVNSQGSIVIPSEVSGIYRVVISCRAATGVSQRNVVMKSAFGERLVTAPTGTDWGKVVDYVAIGDLCKKVEIRPYRNGVEVQEADMVRVKELHLPIQDYITIPEPNQDTISGINPPTFRWPSIAGASKYTVIYKPVDAAWTAATTATLTRQGDIQPLFYRPSLALVPGEWEWKLQVNGRDSCGPYRFVVSPQAIKWELKPWNDYYKHFKVSRPRLLVGNKEIAILKTNVNVAMKNYADRLIADLNAKIGCEFNNSSQVGNSNPGNIVKGLASLRTVLAISRPIPEYLILGKALDRSDYNAEALRRTLLLLEKFEQQSFSHDGDFANGMIMQGLAFTYDYLYDQLTPDQRIRIRDHIVKRLKSTRYTELPRYLFNTHAWQFVMHQAVSAAMAIWDEEPYAEDFLKYSLPLYASLFPWYSKSDGGSAECTHYGLETNLLPALVVRQMWVNFCAFDLKDNPWFKNTIWFVLYSYPNDVQSSWFGDNGPDPNSTLGGVAPLYAALYSRIIPNPYAEGFSARYLNLKSADLDKLSHGYIYRILPLLYGPFAANTSEKPASLPLAHVFGDTGVVIANTDMTSAGDNVTLEFRSSPYGAYGHAHADQNSFNIMAYGDKLVVDSGYYTSFHDKHHYGYTIRTKAHNTILADGQEQPVTCTYGWGRITAFNQGRNYVWMRGDAAAAYLTPNLSKFDRSILFFRKADGRAFSVIYDDLSSEDTAAHRYSWLLHLTSGKPGINTAKSQLNALAERSAIQVNWLRPDKLDFKVSDKVSPPPVIWEFRKHEFPEQLPEQWHIAAEATADNGRQSFITVIQIGRKSDAHDFVVPTINGNTVSIGQYQVSRTEKRIRITQSGKAYADFSIDDLQGNSVD